MSRFSLQTRRSKDRAATLLLYCAALLLCAGVFFALYFVASRGWQVISWEFITEPPRDGMTAGGIWTPLVGTLQLTFLSMMATIPVGVATGLYFSEYASDNAFTRILRLAIRSLAGVPSVVFGLFGLSLFVVLLGFGSSMLSASLTLACLALPLMITASEQAFMAVPKEYRDASYALGATRWQTICKVVFPSAASTVVTGIILSVGRVAGETAPIIFTGAAFYTPGLARSIFEEVMALPYHIYVLATAGVNIEQTRPIQYGAILVLVVLVLSVSSLGIWMRRRRL
ncbi:MAG: phosphate ABC transporter permease PstA [Fretibacterium sp.]|nr:phosphate ABC transporter permease PstA [Fretibacterium sp.]